MEWRPITEAEFERYVRDIEGAFGMTPEDGYAAMVRPVTELDRTRVAVEAGVFAATGAGLTFELTVPGPAVVPAAGVTDVTVRRTHRRRGLLNQLIGELFSDADARGEVVSVLIASESKIYGRYGYGVGTWLAEMCVARHLVKPLPVPDAGSVELLDDDQARVVLPELWDRHRRGCVGELSRPEGFWSAFFADPDRKEHGQRYDLVHRDAAGLTDGWAGYRQHTRWQTGLIDGTLRAEQLVATTAGARLALWHQLLRTDLTTEVRVITHPDDPVWLTVDDGRRIESRHRRDHLWVRLLDVEAALARRRYDTDDELVLEVVDAFDPARGGRFELRVEGGDAVCRRSERPADVTIATGDLASLWLGGLAAPTLAAVGRLGDAPPELVRRLGALFRVEPAPVCVTDF